VLRLGECGGTNLAVSKVERYRGEKKEDTSIGLKDGHESGQKVVDGEEVEIW
jgi:hypothetical protein